MKTTMKKFRLLAMMLGLSLFIACDKSDILDVKAITTGMPGETASSEVSDELNPYSLNLNLENSLRVQFSDDEKVVIIIEGQGIDEMGNQVRITESRIIDLKTRTMEGEGLLEIGGVGNIVFTSNSSSFPLPHEEASISYGYALEIVHTNISEWESPDILNYTVTKAEDNLIEKTLISE